ncbi:hypothetical protein ENBRE01_1364 [Enteropsectra breve]|nr:hypothetical protein ENBRE01_1364 [Enteropsectra breve]
MRLEEMLLSDYGTVPQAIGLYLLKKNMRTLAEIRKNVNLSEHEVKNGLAILIQRRFVKFFIFEKRILYQIERKNIRRRLYFAHYVRSIEEKYSKEVSEYFRMVLLKGIHKEAEEHALSQMLLEKNILQYDVSQDKKKNRSDDFDFENNSTKSRRLSHLFLCVNYDCMDQLILSDEMIKYIGRRYNDAAAEIFKAILKVSLIDRESVLANLESTKILISDNNMLINEKENINEYMKYFSYAGIIKRASDSAHCYMYHPSAEHLKIYKINQMLSAPEERRLFNMVYSQKNIADKDITMYSLLGINKIKKTVLNLQKEGLISQKCMGDYKIGSRIEHSWHVSMASTSKLIGKEIEKEIQSKLEPFNKCWEKNYYVTDNYGNENVWVSDILSLGLSFLIFDLE